VGYVPRLVGLACNSGEQEMTHEDDDTQLDIDGLLDKYFGGSRGSIIITTTYTDKAKRDG
jgi:hypothetical protein